MKTLKHPLFIISIILFGLNQLAEQAELFIWPLHTHLDDLLCLPISLSIILAAERLYFSDQKLTLPKRHLILAVVLFSLIFEGVLPLFSERYTMDAWDIVAYTLGAWIFHKTINSARQAQYSRI